MATAFRLSYFIFLCKSNLSKNLVTFLARYHKENIKRFKYVSGTVNTTFISSVFLLKAVGWTTQSSPDSLKDLFKEADHLYDCNQFDELYNILIKYKDKMNEEILWRLARVLYEKSKITTHLPEKKLLILEAFEYSKKSLEINSNNFAVHKWYAIVLDCIGKYEGTKTRINNALIVRDHFKKAIEINPKDATSIHSLGYWCFLFADLPWYQRQIASIIFATPPTSTFDEALYYFQKAEELDPNFYSMNLLMLAKTLLRKNNTKLALLYLTKVKDYPIKTIEDKEAHAEALKLLISLGIKVDH